MGAAALKYRLLEPLAVWPLAPGQPLLYNLTIRHADTDMRLLYRQDVHCMWRLLYMNKEYVTDSYIKQYIQEDMGIRDYIYM